jgi:hypothetical protein
VPPLPAMISHPGYSPLLGSPAATQTALWERGILPHFPMPAFMGTVRIRLWPPTGCERHIASISTGSTGMRPVWSMRLTAQWLPLTCSASRPASGLWSVIPQWASARCGGHRAAGACHLDEHGAGRNEPGSQRAQGNTPAPDDRSRAHASGHFLCSRHSLQKCIDNMMSL